MLAPRLGVIVVAGMLAALAGACVNLKYPAGASRDGGGDVVAHLGTGQACSMSKQCQSGFCVDGFCCKTECSEGCFTCAKPGNEGFCMPADVGAADPRNKCAKPRVACGENGLCDGSGGCQKDPIGTPCRDSSCASANEVTLQGRCNSDGVCEAGPKQDCSPYVCSGGRCLTQCASSADCVSEPGAMCDANGSCGALKALGGACKVTADCLKGTCSQGVCCAVDCSGTCMSCALKGSEGSCLPVPAGQPPSDPTTCKASDPSMCGLDGSCDGAGACRNWVSGTQCSPASCSSATLRGAGTCDGKTHCQVPAAVSCGGFLCASPTACRTTCTDDTQCASPSVCGAPTETACGGLSAQYFRQTNLTDLAISRTDPSINFHWGTKSPNPLLNSDNFSVRWHGKLTPRFSEDYTFYASTDDGERLFIGGVLVIDRWVRKPADPEDVAVVPQLKAGVPIDVVLEYFESGGDATAVLSWSSKSEPKDVIPTSALSPQ